MRGTARRHGFVHIGAHLAAKGVLGHMRQIHAISTCTEGNRSFVAGVRSGIHVFLPRSRPTPAGFWYRDPNPTKTGHWDHDPSRALGYRRPCLGADPALSQPDLGLVYVDEVTVYLVISCPLACSKIGSNSTTWGNGGPPTSSRVSGGPSMPTLSCPMPAHKRFGCP